VEFPEGTIADRGRRHPEHTRGAQWWLRAAVCVLGVRPGGRWCSTVAGGGAGGERTALGGGCATLLPEGGAADWLKASRLPAKATLGETVADGGATWTGGCCFFFFRAAAFMTRAMTSRGGRSGSSGRSRQRPAGDSHTSRFGTGPTSSRTRSTATWPTVQRVERWLALAGLGAVGRRPRRLLGRRGNRRVQKNP